MTRRRRDRVAAIEILDDAVRLLRAAPWSAHLCFQVGSLPFVLGLLLFVVDMRRSALAPRHAAGGALVVALLYLWMKGWQAVSADRLRQALTGERATARPAGLLRRALGQAAIQPWSLYLLPAALVATIPFAWVYAYYHAATVTGDPAAARVQAIGRPLENHVLVLLLSLASFVVFIDLAAVVMGLPFVLASLLGIDTPFSRSPMLMFDATVLLAIGGLTYLVTAPLAHAAYLLRAEQAAALRSGSDLLREVEALAPPTSGRAVACVLVALLALAGMGVAGPVLAATAPPPASTAAGAAKPGALAPEDLDQAMRAVTARPEFLWRMPRPVPPPGGKNEPGVVARFLRSALETIEDWGKGIGRAVARLYRWLEKRLNAPGPAPSAGASPAWPVPTSWMLLAVIVLGGALALLVWWRRRPPVQELRAEATAPQATVDVGTAAPTDAPSDEWRARARELLDQGDLRLAARAMYLATLALLGEARLLTLGRARSDRDYLLELRRRRPDRPEMADLLHGGVRQFERVWYGTHPASVELVHDLSERCESLRRHARG